MAKRKPKPKVPQTAAEKQARASLTLAQQLGIAQTRSRATAASKGAFKERQLRAAGDMSRYNMAKYKSDPFPNVTVTPPGGYGPTTTRKPAAATSPKPKAKTAVSESERVARQIAEQRKRDAAARAAKRAKAKSVSDGTANNAGSKGNAPKAL